VDYTRSKLSEADFKTLSKAIAVSIASAAVIVGGALTLTGKISPWTGRFYSLLDPSYAKNNIPIIASVSEHQPTSWSSFYFDLQILVFLFPAGMYFCFSKLSDANIFIILYGITSIYFAVRIYTFLRMEAKNLSLMPLVFRCRSGKRHQAWRLLGQC